MRKRDSLLAPSLNLRREGFASLFQRLRQSVDFSLKFIQRLFLTKMAHCIATLLDFQCKTGIKRLNQLHDAQAELFSPSVKRLPPVQLAQALQE